MNVPASANRRQFLQGSTALGLIIGFHLPGASRAVAQEAAAVFEPNAFIRIAPDNTVTVVCKFIEFGQGPYTGIATVLADELDADWDQMRVESAPADVVKYANAAFGVQGTGGSTAMADSWDQLRKAGAEARSRLVAAAAKKWGADAGSISIEKGVVKDASGNSATFGDLAQLAQETEGAGPFQPKDPKSWKLIGANKLPKVDTVEKTNGKATYTIDVKMPDMLTCVLARPSRFHAKVKSFDAAAALAIPGVKEVVAVPQGVAVLAESFWAAKKGRDAVKVVWDEAGTEARGSDEIVSQYVELAGKQGAVARNDGDADAALAAAGSKVIEATYVFPFLAHAPMEPNNCVIWRTEDGGVAMEFGSQLQTVDQNVAAHVLGLKPEQVRIKTLLAGGSFGRRATPMGDMAAEAAEVLKAAKHKGPIKVLWTREDDIKGGRYRPIFVHKLRGAVDKDGNIAAWDQVIVGQSFMKGSPFEEAMVKNGVDQTMVEGASTLPYQIPNLRVSAHITDVGVPTLWWRSVGSTHTAFSTETFLDQLAQAAGVDPLAVRRKLLGKHPRHLGVLELAVEKAGWDKPVAEGRARGLAVHESFHSFVAHVVEVSAGKDGLPKVERVVVAADCGIAINPDVVKAQLEGGMGFGLSAAMFASVDLDQGRVVQSNFDDYRVLRIDEMPDVEVHIVASKEKPTGIGEPGTPPIAPAIANAWAKLTGQRVFALPFTHSAAKA